MRRNSAKRLALALPLVLGALLGGAGSAAAGQLTKEGDTWVFRSAPGEDNDFRVALDEERAGGGYLRFGDRYDLAGAVPDDCYQLDFESNDRQTLRCKFANVRAELGDNSPTWVEWGIVSEDLPANLQITIDGGPGVDRLTGPLRGAGVTLLGGEGNDELRGGDMNDVLDGGPGNDRLDGSGGNDTVRGGEGDDDLAGDGVTRGSDTIDGGPGIDRISSDWIQNDRGNGRLQISLDGVANDGHPGENDNVVNVERFELFQPTAFAAGGDGAYVKLLNTSADPSSLIGGPGPDTLISYDAADTIDGKGGDDVIEGGYGDDVITGGPGRDQINADAGPQSCNFLVCRIGAGNDTVNVRDGEVDSVVCGPGNDTVVADANDTVAADCETVDRAGGGGTPPDRRDGRTPPRPRSRPRPRSGRACVVPKLKAGSSWAAAKKALAKKGCAATSKRVRSAKVRKGRVVKLSHKAGARLKARAKVTVYLSRGRR
ncbi:calcium-binding protein [Conexibacter sp. JD483]|uniref:calcium-binding protein n=1 Tax=unclassified Conexibacter TaxID=2627773 RepID=UPI0027265215|nr:MULTISPECIES: calcium-binding protein [unclassified Conexibacter]MDO8187431.1 calcium-binding protein [Conexibacter sp. CPCC 205706]MDO8198665.1 calcium-binding protein [Conexibacter sp. CPCC 205762]MDR9369843.1 calcium-binding protein [Conexibacter sp. JD483]